MNRITILEQEVAKLYEAGNPEADPWIDWGYPNHVLVVNKFIEELADRFGGNKELCVAAALLHDIGDAVTHRSNPEHEAESAKVGGQLLALSGFSTEEKEIIFRDIIEPHSCRNGAPQTTEGKILATADALAHLKTDFYLHFAWRHFGGGDDSLDYPAFKAWVLKRLEKDFTMKIQFEEIRQEVGPDYLALKRVFSH